jgi:hypothetical protein
MRLVGSRSSQQGLNKQVHQEHERQQQTHVDRAALQFVWRPFLHVTRRWLRRDKRVAEVADYSNPAPA